MNHKAIVKDADLLYVMVEADFDKPLRDHLGSSKRL